MSFTFFTRPSGVWPAGSIILRVLAGITIFKYGLELFDSTSMQGYSAWLRDIGFPIPAAAAYAGKVAELAGGLLLTVGLFTRLASLLLTIVMAIIVFVMGKPEWLAVDGGLFLFLIFLHFFFTGAGPWSMDAWRAGRILTKQSGI